MMTPAARSCSSRGILYLLVEESAREMPARLLIAIQAARLGFEVVIGPQWALVEQAGRLPVGVVLFKGNNTIQVDNMARMRAAGHAVASIEEEILGLIDETRILATYDPRVTRHCDLVLAQGAFQRDCLERRHPGLAGKVAVTGNPRLDLLRAPLNASVLRVAARIREARGQRMGRGLGQERGQQRFILVNSNYSSINPIQGDALTGFQGWVQAGFAERDAPADIDYFLSYCDWERENLRALLGFLGAAARGGLAGRLVLRPHPAENVQRWRAGLGGELGEGLGRGLGRGLGEDAPVEIIEDSDHLAWIAASAGLVHTSCTTGLEAALLGTPSLNIVTGDSPWPDYYATKIASTTLAGPRDAVAAALAHLDEAEEGSRDGPGEGPGEGPSEGPSDASPDLPPGLAEHFLIDGTSAAERVAEALAGLHARSGFQDAGALDLAEHRLADWQARKFSATAADAREMLTDFTSALGLGGAIGVEALAGGSLLVRSAA